MTAENLLSALDGVRFKLDSSDFNAILRRFGDLEKWQQVGLVFDWMKVNKKLVPTTVTSFFAMMGKAGHPEKALRAYKGLTISDIRRNKFVCNALFKILIESAYVKEAFNLFDEIKMDGFMPDLYTYSTLIAGCAKHEGAYLKAECLMEEIAARGLKPDSSVYESLLNVCASFGLEDEANSLFERMKTDDLSPNIYHYSALLNMYAEKGKPDEAEKVFEQMKEAGLPSSKVTLNSLIKAYSIGGQLEKARSLFNKMQHLGFPPDDVSYCLMMDLYCKAGMLEEAHLLFEEMKKTITISGSNGYCILISAYSKMGNVGKVELLTKEVESRKQGISDLILFNVLLNSYCELGMINTVMKLLERMEEESVAPDCATFNILISHFCKQESFDLALRALDDLKARKLRADLNSYAPLVAGLADAGKVDAAMALVAEMKDTKIAVPSSVFDSLIEALCKGRRADEAFMYLKDMLERSLSPAPISLEQLLILAGSRMDILDKIFESNMCLFYLKEVNFVLVLSAYQEQGYHDAILKAIKLVQEHSYVANNEELNHFVGSLQHAGQTEEGTRMLIANS